MSLSSALNAYRNEELIEFILTRHSCASNQKLMHISKQDSLEAERIVELAERLNNKYRGTSLASIAQKEGVKLLYDVQKRTENSNFIVIAKNGQVEDVRLSFFLQLASIRLSQ